MSDWISRFIEKKVMNEVKKQLNIEVKDGQVTLGPTVSPPVAAEMTKECKYCNTVMPLKEAFCPKCERAMF